MTAQCRHVSLALGDVYVLFLFFLRFSFFELGVPYRTDRRTDGEDQKCDLVFKRAERDVTKLN